MTSTEPEPGDTVAGVQESPMAKDRWLTTKEASTILKMSPRTLDRFRDQGKIQSRLLAKPVGGVKRLYLAEDVKPTGSLSRIARGGLCRS